MTVAYRFGIFELQPDQRRLLAHGEPVPLGQRAFDVLHALIERRERLVAKNELLDLVWPGVVVEENNLQVQISSLRKLLGPQAIATVPGRGYRFTAALDGERGRTRSAGQGPVADATRDRRIVAAPDEPPQRTARPVRPGGRTACVSFPCSYAP